MKRTCVIIIVGILMICGIIGVKQTYKQEKLESMIQKQESLIRVLIKNNGFQGIIHERVAVSAPSGLYVQGEKKNTLYEIQADENTFSNGIIEIEPVEKSEAISIQSIERACGIPSYEGVLELFLTEDGIVIVNEIDVEDYLENVVPSEMPASYEIEALKAQAVCARNYVYSHLNRMAYPEYRANVDDSTSFQVYGNAARNKRTSEAVKATEGVAVWYEDEMAVTYFYSTSCGTTASVSEDYTYLASVEVKDEEGNDFEENVPWYRWETSINKADIVKQLEQYAKKEIGELVSFQVEKIEESGRVQRIRAIGTKGEIVVESEYQIRSALANPGEEILRQDGSVVCCSQLLPSAFFTVTEEKDAFNLQGGGYGHGIGMSQNAANEMAKEGWDYKSILSFFYPGTTVY